MGAGMKIGKFNTCEICLEGKKAFQQLETKTVEEYKQLDRIHSDLYGPTQTQTVKQKLPKFVELMKTAKIQKPIENNCDRRVELYTSQLNGIAERKNRTSIERSISTQSSRQRVYPKRYEIRNREK